MTNQEIIDYYVELKGAEMEASKAFLEAQQPTSKASKKELKILRNALSRANAAHNAVEVIVESIWRTK